MLIPYFNFVGTDIYIYQNMDRESNTNQIIHTAETIIVTSIYEVKKKKKLYIWYNKQNTMTKDLRIYQIKLYGETHDILFLIIRNPWHIDTYKQGMLKKLQSLPLSTGQNSKTASLAYKIRSFVQVKLVWILI